MHALKVPFAVLSLLLVPSEGMAQVYGLPQVEETKALQEFTKALDSAVVRRGLEGGPDGRFVEDLSRLPAKDLLTIREALQGANGAETEQAGFEAFDRTGFVSLRGLVLPRTIDQKRLPEILKTWEQLKAMCPECANAGVWTGVGIRGPKTPCPPVPKPEAFPIDRKVGQGTEDTVTISRAEYLKLVKRTSGATEAGEEEEKP